MINCLFKLTAAQRDFACDSTGFLLVISVKKSQRRVTTKRQ